MERLDKIISNQLNIPRSRVRRDIRGGKASVSGETVGNAGLLLDPQSADIVYCGQRVNYKKYIYIIMNKPAGVLSATEDKAKQTVVDLVPEGLRRASLFPVGRLDRDTTGLLLITDDGAFAHNIISPKKNIVKTYRVTLDGKPNGEAIKAFADGIILADGTKCRPAVLRICDGFDVEVEISEGKYHQIKRMFGVLGLGVNKLKRIALGGLKLPENLTEGDSRELSKTELEQIFDN